MPYGSYGHCNDGYQLFGYPYDNYNCSQNYGYDKYFLDPFATKWLGSGFDNNGHMLDAYRHFENELKNMFYRARPAGYNHWNGEDFRPQYAATRGRFRPTRADFDYGWQFNRGDFYDNHRGYHNGRCFSYAYSRRDDARVDRAEKRRRFHRNEYVVGHRGRNDSRMAANFYERMAQGGEVGIYNRRENAVLDDTERIIIVTVAQQPTHEPLPVVEVEREIIPNDEIVLSPTPELVDDHCAEEEFEHVEKTEDQPDEAAALPIKQIAVDDARSGEEERCDVLEQPAHLTNQPALLLSETELSDSEDWEQL